ncbi:hypothetical protein TSTA_100350 [Talaromyces stipitatus ATCC 10500]|uniref:Uncharacterized protein n=1 Tax=Talaromyces stipitatus (strain ATCC 10500 / CBS 375.48 / QM 6759 / NRRL 1006) TaxID=441959 RepID=B8MMN6_TALSN|nr:uncharacterized protein TSTA_100350 [Talaromyces stipitatus ATCC 10500]EED13790.1 hypothetical protein TSTA_100350 [Talaromyces stipitatus ATCC 10500]
MLLHRARTEKLNVVSLRALFGGPHGISETVAHNEIILVVASGNGVVAIIHGYNTSTTQAGRLYFVWQVETLSKHLQAMAKKLN